MESLKIRTKIDLQSLVNAETGETFMSENPNTRIYCEKDTDIVKMKSKNFMLIETDALDFALHNLSPTDYVRFCTISQNLRTDLNVCYNSNNQPHTRSSLAKLFNANPDEISRSMGRMIRLKIVGALHIGEDSAKVYMVNPSIIRKRTTIYKEILKFFPDYRIEEVRNQNALNKK